MAKEEVERTIPISAYERSMIENYQLGLNAGYTLALEHNNVTELIGALRKIMEMCDGNDPSRSSFYYCAQETLTKAEKNKLNK